MQVTGIVTFNAFEGGFWGVLGDNGKKYRPTALPEAFREEGLRVVIEGERSSAMSIHMWGIAIDIASISAPDRTTDVEHDVEAPSESADEVVGNEGESES